MSLLVRYFHFSLGTAGTNEPSSRSSDSPAFSPAAGASNTPESVSTSVQLAPAPGAVTSIIVPFLLAEHQERTLHLRATQERVVRPAVIYVLLPFFPQLTSFPTRVY